MLTAYGSYRGCKAKNRPVEWGCRILTRGIDIAGELQEVPLPNIHNRLLSQLRAVSTKASDMRRRIQALTLRNDRIQRPRALLRSFTAVAWSLRRSVRLRPQSLPGRSCSW